MFGGWKNSIKTFCNSGKSMYKGLDVGSILEHLGNREMFGWSGVRKGTAVGDESGKAAGARDHGDLANDIMYMKDSILQWKKK